MVNPDTVIRIVHTIKSSKDLGATGALACGVQKMVQCHQNCPVFDGAEVIASASDPKVRGFESIIAHVSED